MKEWKNEKFDQKLNWLNTNTKWKKDENKFFAIKKSLTKKLKKSRKNKLKLIQFESCDNLLNQFQYYSSFFSIQFNWNHSFVKNNNSN